LLLKPDGSNGIIKYTYVKERLNHKAAYAFYFAHYNFYRIHSSLRVTPAMESGITDHAWSLSELLAA